MPEMYATRPTSGLFSVVASVSYWLIVLNGNEAGSCFYLKGVSKSVREPF